MDRKDYVARLHARIDQWAAQLDRAETRLKEVRDDARKTYADALRTLGAKLDELRTRARELERAGEGTWDAVRKSVEAGVATFRREYERAREERKIDQVELLEPEADGTDTDQ